MNVDTDKPVKTTKPRRRFRFRLGTMLIVVTLLSIPCGWIGWELDRRRQEKEAIDWIVEIGGEVEFGSFYGSDEISWWEKKKDKWFGLSVWSADLEGKSVSDLSPLTELKNLKNLRFSSAVVVDLSPLAGLNKLETLDFAGGKRALDLSPLAGLKRLRSLWLPLTQVDDVSPLAELKRLRVLSLHSAPVNDLSPLKELKNLEKLYGMCQRH